MKKDCAFGACTPFERELIRKDGGRVPVLIVTALQEKSFARLGGTRTIPIDVRLVAATNRNLTQMMGDNLFRSDLYYRLRVFPIVKPPLRDHPEDIPLLARHFVKRFAGRMGRKIEKIPAETMRALVAFPWPGNVRELENFIERARETGGPRSNKWSGITSCAFSARPAAW